MSSIFLPFFFSLLLSLALHAFLSAHVREASTTLTYMLCRAKSVEGTLRGVARARYKMYATPPPHRLHPLFKKWFKFVPLTKTLSLQSSARFYDNVPG